MRKPLDKTFETVGLKDFEIVLGNNQRFCGLLTECSQLLIPENYLMSFKGHL